jgi:hypothetical protein
MPINNLYRQMQATVQGATPNMGGTGNPGGVYNTDWSAQAGALLGPQFGTYSGQQPFLGRYRPPTMAGNGTDPTAWNDYGGYSYNLPNAYGPGQGGFGYGGYAPQLDQFAQMLSQYGGGVPQTQQGAPQGIPVRQPGQATGPTFNSFDSARPDPRSLPRDPSGAFGNPQQGDYGRGANGGDPSYLSPLKYGYSDPYADSHTKPMVGGTNTYDAPEDPAMYDRNFVNDRARFRYFGRGPGG